MQEPTISAIVNFVKNGGSLLLMGNKAGDMEFVNFNKLN